MKVLHVYETAYNTKEAVPLVQALLNQYSDWRFDNGTNTKASGGRTLVQRSIGSGKATMSFGEGFEHTNQVSARWIFQREVMRRFPDALGVALTDAVKFDALIGFNGSAYYQVVRIAHDVVDAYIDNVILKQKRLDPYQVRPVLMRPDDVVPFTNSAHEGYSGLNKLELAFAKALDETGYDWCRNPARSGYGIPLITLGATRNFYPDFLVWVDEAYCTRHHRTAPASGEDRPQVAVHYAPKGRVRAVVGSLRLARSLERRRRVSRPDRLHRLGPQAGWQPPSNTRRRSQRQYHRIPQAQVRAR